MNINQRVQKRSSYDLAAQINELKQISIDIGVELKDQDAMMRNMHSEFDGAGAMLEKMTLGVKRLIGIVRKDWSIWVLMAFLFFVILYLYFRFNR